MKKTKKLLSVLICVMLILSLTTTAYAAENNYADARVCDVNFSKENSLPGDYLYEQQYVDYLIANGMDTDRYYFSAWYTYQEVYYYYEENNVTDTPDWVLAFSHTPIFSEAFCYGIFGNYVLASNNIYYPSSFGYRVYIPAENKFYTFEEAWSKGIKGIEHAISDYILPNTKFYYDDDYFVGAQLIGDADGDGVITIVDATTIQMTLAELLQYNSYDDIRRHEAIGEEELSFVTDFDRDGDVTIMDATSIQRNLAKLDVDKIEDDNKELPASTSIDYVTEVNIDSLQRYDRHVEFSDYALGVNVKNNGIWPVRDEKIFRTYAEYAAYFNKTYDKFDEEFFNDKALVYICREFCLPTHTFDVSGLSVDNSTLSIKLNEFVEHPETVACVTYKQSMFVSVDKNALDGVDTISVDNTVVDIYPDKY